MKSIDETVMNMRGLTTLSLLTLSGFLLGCEKDYSSRSETSITPVAREGGMAQSYSSKESCNSSTADYVAITYNNPEYFCIQGDKVIRNAVTSPNENGTLCRLGTTTPSPYAGTLFECALESNKLVLYACKGYSNCQGEVRRNVRGERIAR